MALTTEPAFCPPADLPPRPPSLDLSWLPNIPWISGTNFGLELVPSIMNGSVAPLLPIPASWVRSRHRATGEVGIHFVIQRVGWADGAIAGNHSEGRNIEVDVVGGRTGGRHMHIGTEILDESVLTLRGAG